jgi:hypothetical protein
MRGNLHGLSSNLRNGALALAWLMPTLAAAAPPDEAVLPPRFHVADAVQPRFLDLLARSATFRAQCQRIADAGVRVVIEIGAPWDFPRQINGLSKLIRDDEGRLAFVRVKLSMTAPWSVLLPHELEHVVEALEGVDVAAIAARRDGRAWKVGGRVFETRRAHDVGLEVDREYRLRSPGDRVPTRTAASAVRTFDPFSGLRWSTSVPRP